MGGFQEIDQVGAARPVTKASWRADDPGRIAEDVARALTVATEGRPGPVHVSLPGDVLETDSGDGPPAPPPPPPAAPAVDQAVIDELLALLAQAKRPLMLAGPAMARGPWWAVLQRLAAITGAPALPMESPRGVNDPALRAASVRLGEADIVVLLGKPLDFSLRFGRPPAFAPGCRFVHVAVDAEPRRERVALAVAAEPGAVVARLLATAPRRAWPRTGWADEVATARAAIPAEWETRRRSAATPMHPLRVCAALQPYLDDGAVLVSDGGEFGQWAQAGLAPSLRLINGLSGSIGSAIPMGIAARLAHPDRTVLVTVGDGTFGFHGFELDTALRYDLPVVVVVGNDARWNAEHQLQIQHYGAARAVGCDLLPTRYDRVAEALGGHGELVERPDQLAAALARAVASRRPACVNVLIDGVAAPTFSAGPPAH
jgi:acetolactate synthase-1/2/3 large subunit